MYTKLDTQRQHAGDRARARLHWLIDSNLSWACRGFPWLHWHRRMFTSVSCRWFHYLSSSTKTGFERTETASTLGGLLKKLDSANCTTFAPATRSSPPPHGYTVLVCHFFDYPSENVTRVSAQRATDMLLKLPNSILLLKIM